jgi:hypothetical protein
MKTCLILGAGATLAHAEHFHPERLRAKNPPLDYTFFEKIEALGIEIPKELHSYAVTAPGPNPFKLRTGQSAPRMEEFFRDLFGDFQEADTRSNTAQAYEQLVDLYVRVLRETTDWIGRDGKKGGPIGRLLACAAEAADELTILTFNHDLVIENEIVKRARLRAQWCLGRGYGEFGESLRFTNPRTPRITNVFRPHGPDCDHSSQVTVLKLHGSLNWYIPMTGRHPSKALLSGTGRFRHVYCSPRREVPHELTFTPAGGRTQYTWPVVVPPVHGKEALIRRILQNVWSDAESTLQAAERLVFVGYSLPVLDVAAERLFRKAVATNTSAGWIDVVNPAPDSAQRYAAVLTPTPMRWYPSIEQFLDVDGFGSSV